MIPKPPLDHGTEPLEVMGEYDILSSNIEAAFADLIHLASQVCAAPIAMIDLNDPHRRWFKSKSGVPAMRIPSNFVFSTETLLQSDLLIINDALQDEKFAGDPVIAI